MYMSLQEINFALFDLLNASEYASNLAIEIAIFIANDLFYWVIFGFVLAWFKGNFLVKKYIVKALIFTCIAFMVSQMISTWFYTPRPFVIDLGRTLIEHKPNGSFPSDHMLFFSTIAFSYIYSAQKKIGFLFLAMAICVAWSRVYLGVHFPFDMMGAGFIALLLNILGLSAWNNYGVQITQKVVAVYRLSLIHI